MKRKILLAIGFTLLLVGVAVYSYYQDGESFNLINVGFVIFGAAIGIGIIVRLIRAKRGRKIRDAFGPVVAAADAYQSIVLSRPTVEQSSEASKHVPTERSSEGP